MATSITFTDGTGAATLSNTLSAPASRFVDWRPITRDEEGTPVTVLSDGARERWLYRTDYGAEFTLDKIPVSELDIVLRLLRWLRGGNSVTVNTGDRSTRVYTCKAFPGWDIPEGPEYQDNRMLLYRLTLKLKNTSAADMLCNYGTVSE